MFDGAIYSRGVPAESDEAAVWDTKAKVTSSLLASEPHDFILAANGEKIPTIDATPEAVLMRAVRSLHAGRHPNRLRVPIPGKNNPLYETPKDFTLFQDLHCMGCAESACRRSTIPIPSRTQVLSVFNRVASSNISSWV